jgi:hypothetical protein
MTLVSSTRCPIRDILLRRARHNVSLERNPSCPLHPPIFTVAVVVQRMGAETSERVVPILRRLCLDNVDMRFISGYHESDT